MDIKKLETIVVLRNCPKCGIGIVLELERGVYQCCRLQCNETYDLSLLAEETIHRLLNGRMSSAGANVK